MMPNTRMAKTLGALVASMTTGAAALFLLQPAPSQPTQAGTALMSNIVQWDAIHVAAQSLDDGVQPNSAHFFVYPDGHDVYTNAWRDQYPLTQAGEIEIVVLVPQATRQATAAQWSKVQSLFSDLQNRCQIPSQRVVMDQSLNLPPA